MMAGYSGMSDDEEGVDEEEVERPGSTRTPKSKSKCWSFSEIRMTASRKD